jgi:hypothetical protein
VQIFYTATHSNVDVASALQSGLKKSTANKGANFVRFADAFNKLNSSKKKQRLS